MLKAVQTSHHAGCMIWTRVTRETSQHDTSTVRSLARVPERLEK